MKKCVPLGRAVDFPREIHETAGTIYEAALREVGLSPEKVWRGDREWNVTPVPEPWHSRAREIAFRALGIPYEWVES